MVSLPPAVTRAANALKQSGHAGLRRLSVESTSATLVISGTVRTYYLKQLAQETLKPVRGELEVVNLVQVD